MNRAIFESGVDLDQLDSTDFANPPRTVMYTRFKNWVNDAYKEILLKRNESFIRNERTVSTIFPRVRVNNVTGTLAINDELQGADSGVRFRVLRITSDVLNPDIRFDLDIEYLDNPIPNFLMGEKLVRNLPTVADPIAFVESLPGWDLTLEAPWIKEIDRSSMLIQDVLNNAVDGNPGTAEPLFQVVWDYWLTYIMYSTDTASTPRYVAEGPDGLLYFWPRPDTAMNLLYDYSRTVGTMSVYTDTPWPIPEEYHLAVVWFAIMKYADFDNKAQIYARAKKNFNFYNNKLEEEKLPEVNMGPNLFWDY